MTKTVSKLSLPAFAFVEGWGDDDPLHGRNVIVHCPTGTIVEAIPEEDALYVNKGVPVLRFGYTGPSGVREPYIMTLHASPAFDKDADNAFIKQLMKSAAAWFVSYLEWEDNNILDGK